MKRWNVAAVALCLALGMLAVATSPAEAAKKALPKVVVKVAQVPDPDELRTPEATICVGLVYDDGSPTDDCSAWMIGTGLQPSTVRSFKVVARWYAGQTVITKRTRQIRNHHNPIWSKAPTAHLTYDQDAPSGKWRWKGKKLWLKVTIVKKGYQKKVVKVRNAKFALDDE